MHSHLEIIIDFEKDVCWGEFEGLGNGFL